ADAGDHVLFHRGMGGGPDRGPRGCRRASPGAASALSAGSEFDPDPNPSLSRLIPNRIEPAVMPTRAPAATCPALWAFASIHDNPTSRAAPWKTPPAVRLVAVQWRDSSTAPANAEAV